MLRSLVGSEMCIRDRFSSANVTEDGATLGTTFAAGESVADWVQGFEDGYNAGYEDGYADGFADGYAAGISDSQ